MNRRDTATGARRAHALLTHWEDHNNDGIKAVLAEVTTSADATMLLMALLAMVENLLNLLPDEAREMVRRSTLGFARLEDETE